MTTRIVAVPRHRGLLNWAPMIGGLGTYFLLELLVYPVPYEVS